MCHINVYVSHTCLEYEMCHIYVKTKKEGEREKEWEKKIREGKRTHEKMRGREKWRK